ncbi:hypothetical protein BKA70DRAFT_1419709 [Coprinopsis sp. MPI-PUGE-AT-0042]|nr:hypothetical protein BKA70DRAFT_1419709 [Coprinopsis sp. MPI-PUGE-AT-0042]
MSTAVIDDILYAIFGELQLSSLTVIVQASTRFRTLALPHLLRSVTFDQDLSRAVGFLEFILSHKDGRDSGAFGVGRHVRELKIGDHALHKNRTWHLKDTTSLDEILACTEYTDTIPVATWSLLLVEALQAMPNLHKLSLGDQTEDLVRNAPQFTSTILAIHPLRSLHLGGIGVGASASLGEACSDLVHAAFHLEVVSLDGTTVGDASDVPLRILPDDGVGRFLRHIGQRITSLRLTSFDLTGLGPFQRHHPTLFPTLRKLALTECNTSISWLASATPAIFTLSLDSFISPDFFKQLPKVAFPRLVDVCAEYGQVLALIRSNALVPENLRRLRLSFDWKEYQANGGRPDFAVPQAASHLRILCFLQRPVQALSWWKALAEVLPRLTCLTISLGATSADQACLSRAQVPRALASVPLEYVSLTLELMERPENFGIETELTEEAIALAWANNIPTLQYMDVRRQQIYSPVVVLGQWLMIERDKGFAAVQRLSVEAGTRIRASYESVRAYKCV